jgi:hypothetical protein
MARQRNIKKAIILAMALFIPAALASLTGIPTDVTQSDPLSVYDFATAKAYTSWRERGSYDPSLATEYGEIPILWSSAGAFLYPDTLSAARSFNHAALGAFSPGVYPKNYCLTLPGDESVAVLKSSVLDILGVSCTWQYAYFIDLFNRFPNAGNIAKTIVDSSFSSYSTLSWRTKIIIIPAFETYPDSMTVFMDEMAARFPDVGTALTDFLAAGGTIYCEGSGAYVLEAYGILPAGSIDLNDPVEGTVSGFCAVDVADTDHPLGFDIPSAGIYTVLGPTIDFPGMVPILTIASSWDPSDIGKPLVAKASIGGGKVLINAGMPPTGAMSGDAPNQWMWSMNAILSAFANKAMNVRSVFTDVDIDSSDVAPIALPVNEAHTFEVTIRVRNLWNVPLNNVSVVEQLRTFYSYVGTTTGPSPSVSYPYLTYNIGTIPAGGEVIITYQLSTPPQDDPVWFSLNDHLFDRTKGLGYVSSSFLYYSDPDDGILKSSYRNNIRVRYLFEADIWADTDLNWKNILGEYFQPFKIFSIFENKERTSALHTKYVQYIPLDVPIYWVDPMDIPIIRTPGGKFVDVLRGDWDRNMNGIVDPGEIFRDLNGDGTPDAWLDVTTMHPKPDNYMTMTVEEVYWLNPWTLEYEDINHNGIRPVDADGDGIFEVEDPGDLIRVIRCEWSYNIDPFPGYGWFDPYASWEIWIDPPPLVGMALGAAEAAGSLYVDIDTIPEVGDEPYYYENWQHWMETDTTTGEIVWKRLVYVHFGAYEGFVFLDDGETVPDPHAIEVGRVPWPRREYIAVLNLGGTEPTMTEPQCDSSNYSWIEYTTIWGKEKKTPIRVSYTYYAPLPNPLQFEYINCTYKITDPTSGAQMQYLPKYGEANIEFELCASTEYSRYWLKNVGQDHGEFDFDYTGEGRGWVRTSNVPDGLGDGVVGYMVHEIPKGLGGYEIDLPRTPGGDIDMGALVEGFWPYMIGFPDVHEEIIVFESPFKWEILIPQILIPPALDDDNLDGIDDWDDDFGDRFVSGTGYLHDIFPPLDGEDAEDTFAVNPWDITTPIEGDLAYPHQGWCPGPDSVYGDDLCEHLGETRLKVRVKYTGKGYEGPAEISKGVWLVNEEIFGGSPWVQWSHAQFANAIGHSIGFASRSATPTVVPLHPDTVIMRWRIAEWDEPREFDIMFDPYLDGSGYGKASITTHVGGREPASLFTPDAYWMARIDPNAQSATITALPDVTPDDTVLYAAGYPKTETGAFLMVLVEVNNNTGAHWYNTTVVPVTTALMGSSNFLWYGCYPRPFVPKHVEFDEVTGEPIITSGDDPRTFTAGWRFNPSADEVLFQLGESDGSITIPEIQSSRRAYFIWHIKLDPNLPVGVYEIPLKISALSRHYTESGPGTPVTVDVPTAKFAIVERSGSTIVQEAYLVSGEAQLTGFSTELWNYVDVTNPSADVRWGYSMPTSANWSTLTPISATMAGSNLLASMPSEVASPWPPSVHINNFWIGAMAEVDPPSASERLPLDKGARGSYNDFMGIPRTFTTSAMSVEARGAKLYLKKSVARVNGVPVDVGGYYYLAQGDNDVQIELVAQNIGNDIAYDIAILGEVGRDAVFVSADSTYPYSFNDETKTVYWEDFAHIPPGAERKIPIDLVVNAAGSDEVLELFYAFAVEFTETDESGEVLPFVRYRPSDNDTIFYGVDLFFNDGDLAISDRQPSVGDNVNLQAKVRIGGNTTAKNVVVRFFEGDQQIGTDRIISELNPADSSATVTVPYTVEKDYTMLFAIVDPDSILGELKEDNNTVALELILGKGDPIRQVVNFPNPFKDYTEFTYILGKPMTDVTIKVFTVRGRSVRTFDMCPNGVGYNSLGWDGTDARGDQIANGTYIYKVMATAENGETHEVIERIVRMR